MVEKQQTKSKVSKMKKSKGKHGNQLNRILSSNTENQQTQILVVYKW
jgi:hypothetical protein